MEDQNRIVRCYGCEANVRAYATRMEPTGEYGDQERWCNDCLSKVDDYSATLIPDKQALLDSALRNVLMDEGDGL